MPRRAPRHDIAAVLAANLRAAREAAGLTPEALDAAALLAPGTVARIEAGGARLGEPVGLSAVLGPVLGVDPETLYLPRAGRQSGQG